MKEPRSAWARRAGPAGLGAGLDRVELAAQLLDLVAEPGRILEAQVVRRGEHLLLELDDRPRDLLRRHRLLAGLALTARGRGDLRLDRQEVGDVGDALTDGLGRDPVLLVVGDLDSPAAVRLADRLAHRLGLLV